MSLVENIPEIDYPKFSIIIDSYPIYIEENFPTKIDDFKNIFLENLIENIDNDIMIGLIIDKNKLLTLGKEKYYNKLEQLFCNKLSGIWDKLFIKINYNTKDQIKIYMEDIDNSISIIEILYKYNLIWNELNNNLMKKYKNNLSNYYNNIISSFNKIIIIGDNDNLIFELELYSF